MTKFRRSVVALGAGVAAWSGGALVASVALMGEAAQAAPPGAPPEVRAAPSYALVGSFTPSVSGVRDVAGVGAGASAGRMYTLASDGGVWLQEAVNGGTFSRVGSVDGALLSGFGPAFLRVSGDGSMLAIGDGNFGSGASVLLVSAASLNPASHSSATSVGAANFDGRWGSDGALYVSGGDAALGSIVTRIDGATHEARVVVSNIGGASGGVTTDGMNLYTANGFDFVPGAGSSDTGEVRAFALSAITSAASSGTPLDFEALGRPVADALTASSLAFDVTGNLLVGGGDFFGGSGDFGYAAAVGAGAIQSALAGGPIAPDGEEQRVSPAGGGEFYGVWWNGATSEWLVGGGGTVYRYAVPAPGAGVMLACALVGGPQRGRRRRDA